jgi:hypothetical protein
LRIARPRFSSASDWLVSTSSVFDTTFTGKVTMLAAVHARCSR